jgi:hypothetical protein
MRYVILFFALSACAPNPYYQQEGYPGQSFDAVLLQAGQPSPYKKNFFQALGEAANSTNGNLPQQPYYSPVNPMIRCTTTKQGVFENTTCY